MPNLVKFREDPDAMLVMSPGKKCDEVPARPSGRGGSPKNRVAVGRCSMP